MKKNTFLQTTSVVEKAVSIALQEAWKLGYEEGLSDHKAAWKNGFNKGQSDAIDKLQDLGLNQLKIFRDKLISDFNRVDDYSHMKDKL